MNESQTKTMKSELANSHAELNDEVWNSKPNEEIRKRKRISIDAEFLDYFFTHPDNVFVKNELPDDVELIRIYEEPSHMAWYFVYQSSEWEPVKEGEKIPLLELEVHELYCQRCDNEMVYDEESKEQYCPRCERRFKTKL